MCFFVTYHCSLLFFFFFVLYFYEILLMSLVYISYFTIKYFKSPLESKQRPSELCWRCREWAGGRFTPVELPYPQLVFTNLSKFILCGFSWLFNRHRNRSSPFTDGEIKTQRSSFPDLRAWVGKKQFAPFLTHCNTHDLSTIPGRWSPGYC